MYRILRQSIFILITFTISCHFAFAQDNFFKIEFDKFSPDAQQMITMMEGNPTESFDAFDMSGSSQKFEDYQGEFLLLWFWDINDEVCISQIDGLNLMNQFFENSIQVIGFAYDKSEAVADFLKQKSIDFPVVPDSFKLGELRYGSELGQGRVFLIDTGGIVHKAIPRQFFEENSNSISLLRNLIKEMIN